MSFLRQPVTVDGEAIGLGVFNGEVIGFAFGTMRVDVRAETGRVVFDLPLACVHLREGIKDAVPPRATERDSRVGNRVTGLLLVGAGNLDRPCID